MSEAATSVKTCAEDCIESKLHLVNTMPNEEISKYSYEDFREHLNILCEIFFRIFYVSYGFVQFLLTLSLFTKVFHDINLFTFLSALVLGYFPVVGTAFGILGSHAIWGWSWSNSVLIFFAIPYFISIGPILMIVLFEAYKDWQRWQSNKITT